MSQVTNYSDTISSSYLNMTVLKSQIESLALAAASANRGPSAPSNPFEGMTWWDTSENPVEVLKRYTATAGWVSLLSVNITSGLFILITPTITTPKFSLGSDADGDMYYRSGGQLARLPKGSRGNMKLFQNSALTGPEWDKGILVGPSFTRDLSAAGGDVTYSGVGFQPGYVEIGGGLQDGKVSMGETDGIHQECWNQYGAATWYLDDAVIECWVDASNWQKAVFKQWTSDGMILTWTKNGNPTGTASFYTTYYR